MRKQTQEKLQSLLEEAVKLDHADKGNIQMYKPVSDDLVIVVQVGFGKDFLDHFRVVKAFDTSACGRAFGIASTVLINDVEEDIGFAPHREIARSAGFRSVKSMPVFSRFRHTLGIISTHFSKPRWLWDTQRLNKLIPEIALVMEEVYK